MATKKKPTSETATKPKHVVEVAVREDDNFDDATAATLTRPEVQAAIKNPPVVFAKQANISSGHQQINNGTASHAGEIKNQQNKLGYQLKTGHPVTSTS